MVGRSRIGAAVALGIVVLLAVAGGAFAKPGQVDTRYGYNGALDVTAALPGPEFGRGVLAAAVGTEDESVVLSYALRPCSGARTCADLYVNRVLADGTLDSGFAARAGIVASVEWGSPSHPGDLPHGAIAVQPDGKVVIASGDGISARIARLNPDGSHDQTFQAPGDGGQPPGQVLVVLGGETFVSGLEIRQGGGIVVAGSSRFPSGPKLFVTRVLGQGQRDRFGVEGIVFADVGGDDLPADLALRGGSTVVGGPACCVASAGKMKVDEFDPTGALADSFAVKVPKRLGVGKPRGVSSVITGPKGSTFVVGSAAKGTFVAKYRGNDSLDTNFGKGGIVPVRGLTSELQSAIRDDRGRIVLVGWRLDVPDTAGFKARFTSTVRLLPNGRLDPTFGGVRPLLVVEERGLKVGLDLNRSIGLVQRSDGLLMMVGEAVADRYAKTPSGPNFGLVRFLAGGRLP